MLFDNWHNAAVKGQAWRARVLNESRIFLCYTPEQEKTGLQEAWTASYGLNFLVSQKDFKIWSCGGKRDGGAKKVLLEARDSEF